MAKTVILYATDTVSINVESDYEALGKIWSHAIKSILTEKEQDAYNAGERSTFRLSKVRFSRILLAISKFKQDNE